jgi:hypothetical protein
VGSEKIDLKIEMTLSGAKQAKQCGYSQLLIE